MFQSPLSWCGSTRLPGAGDCRQVRGPAVWPRVGLAHTGKRRVSHTGPRSRPIKPSSHVFVRCVSQGVDFFRGPLSFFRGWM